MNNEYKEFTNTEWQIMLNERAQALFNLRNGLALLNRKWKEKKRQNKILKKLHYWDYSFIFKFSHLIAKSNEEHYLINKISSQIEKENWSIASESYVSPLPTYWETYFNLLNDNQLEVFIHLLNLFAVEKLLYGIEELDGRKRVYNQMKTVANELRNKNRSFNESSRLITEYIPGWWD